jgi:NTP pyrophosphatase (non-canonical NTP hydrolase)
MTDLTLDEYQQLATKTAFYPGQGSLQGLTYAALGLNGEAGETAEQVKKTWRDDSTSDLLEAVLERVEIFFNTLNLPTNSPSSDALRADLAEVFRQPLSEERRDKMIKELGDTLWYAAQMATELGISLGEVAQMNVDKLAERNASNKIHGEGSDR